MSGFVFYTTTTHSLSQSSSLYTSSSYSSSESEKQKDSDSSFDHDYPATEQEIVNASTGLDLLNNLNSSEEDSESITGRPGSFSEKDVLFPDNLSENDSLFFENLSVNELPNTDDVQEKCLSERRWSHKTSTSGRVKKLEKCEKNNIALGDMFEVVATNNTTLTNSKELTLSNSESADDSSESTAPLQENLSEKDVSYPETLREKDLLVADDLQETNPSEKSCGKSDSENISQNEITPSIPISGNVDKDGAKPRINKLRPERQGEFFGRKKMPNRTRSTDDGGVSNASLSASDEVSRVEMRRGTYNKRVSENALKSKYSHLMNDETPTTEPTSTVSSTSVNRINTNSSNLTNSSSSTSPLTVGSSLNEYDGKVCWSKSDETINLGNEATNLENFKTLIVDKQTKNKHNKGFKDLWKISKYKDCDEKSIHAKKGALLGTSPLYKGWLRCFELLKNYLREKKVMTIFTCTLHAALKELTTLKEIKDSGKSEPGIPINTILKFYIKIDGGTYNPLGINGSDNVKRLNAKIKHVLNRVFAKNAREPVFKALHQSNVGYEW